jgi:hypothetical protein
LSRGRVVTNLQNELDGSLSNGFVRVTCHTDEQILAVAPVEVGLKDGQHNILLILRKRLVHLHGLEVSSKIRQMICVKNRNRKQPSFYSPVQAWTGLGRHSQGLQIKGKARP